ncbi:MAG: hypothetical protein LBH16_10795 [Treponema sp.]|jgi:hypothetical protein|nr:hypothetical protein [Treponema sp.]
MNRRGVYLFIFVTLTASVSLCAPDLLNAQTAGEIETLIKTKTVTYAQAARFVLEAADVSGSYDRSSPEQAFRFAAGKKWLPARVSSSENINLRQAALLIMRAFDVKGGPQYTLFKTANYAFREMVYLDIIHDNVNPGMSVSGDMLLYMVSRILYLKDDAPWTLPEEKIVIVPEEPEKEPEPEPAVKITKTDEAVKPADTLAQKLLLLESGAQDGEVYIFDINNNETIGSCYLFYEGKTIGITIRGGDTERTISLNGAGSMFSIGPGVTLTLEKNITLCGIINNTDSLLKVSGGTLVINNGTKITGNSTMYGGGVYLLNGDFTMNGGHISGNSAFNGSGVYIGWEKTFTMNGGVISGNGSHYGGGVYVSTEGNLAVNNGIIAGNTAHYGGGVYISSDGKFSFSRGNVSDNVAVYSGGGVYISNGSLIMNGGVISGNTAGVAGGGVYLFYYGFFSKTGGTIFGNDNSAGMNAVKDSMGNVVYSGAGHAVYATNSFGEIIRRRESTSGPDDALSLSYSNDAGPSVRAAPVWTGRWE